MKNENNKSKLKRAFEAGEVFNGDCHCGKCDYCIDVKICDAPSFEEWYELFLNENNSTPSNSAEKLAEENVQYHAQTYCKDLGYSITGSQYSAFIAGFNLQNTQHINAVIELIEARVKAIEGNGYTVLTVTKVNELTDLITQIKELK